MRRRSNARCGLWFFTGLSIGLLAAGLVWLKLSANNASTIVESAVTTPAPATANPKPDFVFYSVLPEMEIVIPEEEIQPPVSQNKAQPSEPAEQKSPDNLGETYMLQLGSFRKSSDAERLKAKLALMGVESAIQKVTINNNDTYFRVRSGPYGSQKKLNDIRARLHKEQIQSMVIKLRG